MDSGDSAGPGASGSASGTSSPGQTSAAEPTTAAGDSDPTGASSSGGVVDTGTSSSGEVVDTGDAGADPDDPVYPDCVPPGEATAWFSATIDGQDEFPVLWGGPDAQIDAPCDVVIADEVAGFLSLSCSDAEGVLRVVDLEFDSEPALSLSLADGPVDLFFNYIRYTDETDHHPDTRGVSFTLSQGGILILAGIDGDYTLWDEHALPDTVTWSTETELCDYETITDCWATERRRGSFEVDGHSAQLFDGHSAALGDDRIVVVDRMEGSRPSPVPDPTGGEACCCTKLPNFVNPRFLIGTPL